MMNTVKEKWPEIIEHLRVEHELSNVSFNTWIQPLKVYDVVDNTVFILVNMNASVEYIEKKYQLPLKVCIAETTGTEYDVVFISEDDDRLNEIQNMAIEANQKKKSKSAAEKAGLNPKYTAGIIISPTQLPLLLPNLREKYTILSSYMEVLDLERPI